MFYVLYGSYQCPRWLSLRFSFRFFFSVYILFMQIRRLYLDGVRRIAPSRTSGSCGSTAASSQQQQRGGPVVFEGSGRGKRHQPTWHLRPAYLTHTNRKRKEAALILNEDRK